MAAPAPTVADLQALIQALQAQNALLQAALSAAPAMGPAAVITCANTPGVFYSGDPSLSINTPVGYLFKTDVTFYFLLCCIM